ncbi:MAG: Hsp20/alpha crystallin family protein [Chloroflexi bacterium]|nr:Hsp20/alpha crystallin family protein [Chloroflexota bacterium]
MSKILIRDPFAEFDSLFSGQWPRAFARRPRRVASTAAGSMPTTSWQLPVNVYENDEGIGIEAWVPGFGEDEISVTVDDGQLTIHAEHASDESSEQGSVEDRKYRRREVARTVLSRSFKLDPAYDSSKISAQLANGVLELSLPKGEEPEPQKIAIHTGAVSEAVAEVIDES